MAERVMMIKEDSKPAILNSNQVYEPTADQEDEDIERLYEQVDCARRESIPDKVTIIMGDLSDRIGEGHRGTIVGDFYLE